MTEYAEIIRQQLENVLDGAGLDRITEDASRISEGLSDAFTLENILNATLEGESIFDGGAWIESLSDLALYELKGAMTVCVEILSICIIVGFIRCLADSFQSRNVSQLSLLVCTMLLSGLCLKSFQTSYDLALDTVSVMVRTMQILLPVMLGILTATGALAGGAVLSPILLGAVVGFGTLIRSLILPALFLSTVLTLINSLTEKNYVNKLAKLIRNGAVFLTGLLVTVLTGVITLQGMLTEASDGLLLGAAKYSLSSFIPIVGGFTADTAEMFLTCMRLIKSVVGVFGVLSLSVVLLVPLIKLLLIGGLYKLTAAFVEPVSEQKVSGGLNDMGSSLMSVAAILFFTSLLFILFLTAILTMGGGKG